MQAPTRKAKGQWLVVPGGAAAAYVEGHGCALGAPRECAAVAAARARGDFAYQLVAPRAAARRGVRLAERVALAPDWLFGRGCLTHVRAPAPLLEALSPGAGARAACEMPPAAPRASMAAPASAAGVLVATHFVYSMALKRKRTFQAFAWDAAPAANRTAYARGTCFGRSSKGILFGHTFFTTMKEKTILCAMPSGRTPECACCAGLPSLRSVQAAVLKAETTAGRPQPGRHVPKLEGCDDYQAFWDR